MGLVFLTELKFMNKSEFFSFNNPSSYLLLKKFSSPQFGPQVAFKFYIT